jgi:uncharacterized protein YcbK (DUF882 family)
MQLTKNFNRQEFDCKDGTKVPDEFLPNVQEVANNLQILRDYLKVPVRVTGSGYRTKSYNKKVGGAKFSQHLTASGADINADGYTPKELAKEIEKLIKEEKMKQGGIGVYKGFVHYDIRGTKARW